MNNIIELLKNIWRELDTIFELFVYLGIAYAISKIFNIGFLQSTVVVFVYFVLNLLRVLVETYSRK